MVYNRLKREKEPEVQEQADGVRFGGLGLRLEFSGTYIHTNSGYISTGLLVSRYVVVILHVYVYMCYSHTHTHTCTCTDSV